MYFYCRHEEVVPFFEVIEKDEAVADMILDYSISQTTLEEVFLNVSLTCISYLWWKLMGLLFSPKLYELKKQNNENLTHIILLLSFLPFSCLFVIFSLLVAVLLNCIAIFSFNMQVTLNELFKDSSYRPMFMRSGSYIASPTTGPHVPIPSELNSVPTDLKT